MKKAGLKLEKIEARAVQKQKMKEAMFFSNFKQDQKDWWDSSSSESEDFNQDYYPILDGMQHSSECDLTEFQNALWDDDCYTYTIPDHIEEQIKGLR